MEQERQFRIREPAAFGSLEPGQELAAGHEMFEERTAVVVVFVFGCGATAAAIFAFGQVFGQSAENRTVVVTDQGGRHRRTPVLHTAARVAGARRRVAVARVSGHRRRSGAHTAGEMLQALRPVPVPEQQRQQQ